MIQQELDRLLSNAQKDADLKAKLIATKSTEDPVSQFCSLCQSLGYNVTIGELFACGQDMNDSKLRSVNGGGVNGIDGWDDTYEQFFLTLEWCK